MSKYTKNYYYTFHTMSSKGLSEILEWEFSEVTLGHLKEKVLKGGVQFFFVLCFKQSFD